MGTNVQSRRFTHTDFSLFSQRLSDNLEVLAELLKQPGFGKGEITLGAELELTLVDAAGNARWLNEEMQKRAADPQLTLEINRYNLEYNLSPVAAAGKPFTKIAREILKKLRHTDELGKPLDARAIAIGILPTLTRRDISARAMTDDNRYHILSKALKKLRSHPVEIDIDGEDKLRMSLPNLNVEGANTSFQVHLRTDPEQFANLFNAAQLASAPALAVSTNSPLLLGHRLWEETRVILFKQSVETRHIHHDHHVGPSRAGLGEDWIQHSALEVFSESVRDFPVLIPQHGTFDDHQALAEGKAPPLAELRLHHGSIWHWNRAIYDPAGAGHLRIEMRALPSGPTPIDMAANAAFIIGLTQGLAEQMPALARQLPFAAIKQNFYHAAKNGLDAELFWPVKGRKRPVATTAAQLIPKLLPVASDGLTALKVSPTEIDHFLGVIEERTAKRQTGARWQLCMLSQLEEQHPREEALHLLLDRYLNNAYSGKPVHEWSTSC